MPKTRNPFQLRNRYYLLIDLAVLILSAVISFAVRLETLSFEPDMILGIVQYVAIAIPLRLIIFALMGMYARYWLNAGPSELLMVMGACVISGVIIWSVVLVVASAQAEISLLPRSVPVIDAMIVTIASVGTRFSARAYGHNYHRRRTDEPSKPASRVLIIGAGNTGMQVLYALENTAEPVSIIGFLDDDHNKIGTRVRGYRVLGGVDELRTIAEDHDVQQVLVAMPSAPGKVIRQIAETCKHLNLKYKIMPGVFELISGRVTVNSLRPVSIDDLLRRPQVNLKIDDIRDYIEGRCVLVTGGGGSIGSELARQLARFRPKQLILLGHGENSLFAAETRLRTEFPELPTHIMLADVRNIRRMEEVFNQWHPQVVFHAAAHKHVPMLETNPVEAVTNNVIGTCNMIKLCNQFEVDRMVMISTDKAVAPTNIMGMTKRTAEMLIILAAQRHPRRFAVVRFGNVLGSRGSIVPIFQQQIASGGPVTVTHPEITRFFMSIPEAVLLVLKAGISVERGPLFVLNMGDPIKIIDLARDMISLSGLQEGRDIEIEITELRPGDKMHESLFWDYERAEPIEDGSIFAARMPHEDYMLRINTLKTDIETLMDAARDHNEARVRKLLPDIVFSLSHAGEPTPIE
ncbi:MAG: polysaccharide biosynthesis protein [Anaerolinea sp.]|nr:polysaccharide biosynthesis protein [Anaerolinea sp.]